MREDYRNGAASAHGAAPQNRTSYTDPNPEIPTWEGGDSSACSGSRGCELLEEWLQRLHRRATDRVASTWIRQALLEHCSLEISLGGGWPTLRLSGELPAGHYGDTYIIGKHYGPALAAVLKELASPGALEVALRRAPSPEAFAALFKGVQR